MPFSRTTRESRARSVAPQPTLMLRPFGSLPTASTSAPSVLNAAGASPE